MNNIRRLWFSVVHKLNENPHLGVSICIEPLREAVSVETPIGPHDDPLREHILALISAVDHCRWVQASNLLFGPIPPRRRRAVVHRVPAQSYCLV